MHSAGFLDNSQLLHRPLHVGLRIRCGVLDHSAAPHTLDIHVQVGLTDVHLIKLSMPRP